jgi:putative inorganic carbon (HCO3(-)) transporter
VPTTSLQIDLWLIASAIVLTCVLFTARAADPVNVIKLTALLLVAIVIATSMGYRTIRHRTMALPVSAAGAAGAALAAALMVAALTAPVVTTAVVGAYGRNSGLLAYIAALILFFAGLRVFQRPNTRVLVGGVVLAGLFTGSYGLLQKSGIDAVAWNNPFNPIIAALGNPNFASGYLGIAASVAVGGALWAGWGRVWRAVCASTAALCLVAAALSSSVQGPIAAAAGLLVVSLAYSLDLNSKVRRWALPSLGLAAGLGVTALLVGALMKAGPAAAVFGDVGTEARTHYWDAALRMFREAPALGVGLDHYGMFWRSTRSPESIEALGGAQYSDAAHSVPLQMLAQGGLVLGIAYGVFVLVTLLALIKGLSQLTGSDRMLLGAVGGGWAAYQVQSAVSIDQVPLIVLHFTLASGVVAVAGSVATRQVRLPGAVQPVAVQPQHGRAKRRVNVPARPKRRALTAADLAMLSVVATIAAAAAWQSVDPLRANIAVREGDRSRSAGDGARALQAYDRATDVLPGESTYWMKKAQLLQASTPRQGAALRAILLEAIQRNPYEINAIRPAAGLAEAAGELELSRQLFSRAVSVDPVNPETLVAAATFELRHGGAARARTILEPAVEALPSQPTLWATLGDARAVLGEPDAARAAYERALALDPAQATASKGLEDLGL